MGHGGGEVDRGDQPALGVLTGPFRHPGDGLQSRIRQARDGPLVGVVSSHRFRLLRPLVAAHAPRGAPHRRTGRVAAPQDQ